MAAMTAGRQQQRAATAVIGGDGGGRRAVSVGGDGWRVAELVAGWRVTTAAVASVSIGSEQRGGDGLRVAAMDGAGGGGMAPYRYRLPK
jgi:hypothetical protein